MSKSSSVIAAAAVVEADMFYLSSVPSCWSFFQEMAQTEDSKLACYKSQELHPCMINVNEWKHWNAARHCENIIT